MSSICTDGRRAKLVLDISCTSVTEKKLLAYKSYLDGFTSRFSKGVRGLRLEEKSARQVARLNNTKSHNSYFRLELSSL